MVDTIIAENTQSRPAAQRPTTQLLIGCVAIPILVTAVIVTAIIYIRSTASAELVIPEHRAVLVRAFPAEDAPLLARFGHSQALTITGRTEDWRWLEVELWQGERGWALRPLDILVWQIEANPVTPSDTQSTPASPAARLAIAEEMVAIPAITFPMGSPPGFGQDDERPLHSVTLSAFEVDRTEVTVGHYWDCVLAGACPAPESYTTSGEPNYLNDPAFDNHPMLNVSWTGANNYCVWRGKRLPTEAEWEAAAGWDSEQGAKLLWVWGNDQVQVGVNTGASSIGQAAVVGSFPADTSVAGVLDMGGNVSEWVFDWYKRDYYAVADDTDPLGPSHRRGEGTGRVVRGGSFADSLDEARTTNRRHQAEQYGFSTVGFRCAR